MEKDRSPCGQRRCQDAANPKITVNVDYDDTNTTGKTLEGAEQVTYTGTSADCEGTFDFSAQRQ